MTTLDKGSAHRRDLYLTKQILYKKQTSMPPVGFGPTIAASACPQTNALDRTATGISFLSYPACESWLFCIALHCHLWHVWLYHISPHDLTNSTIFGKNLLNTKYVSWFSLQPFSEIFFILRRIHSDTTIIVCRSSWKVPLFLSDFNKLAFSQQILKKSWNIKFHYNPCSRKWVVPCGWADRQTAMWS
jgi:hypothetical protein